MPKSPFLIKTDGKQYFSKVKQARETIREKSVEIYNTLLEGIIKAQEAGDHQSALKALQWLLEHAPDDNGETILNPSIDKSGGGPSGPTGPAIQIGIALGGMKPEQKALADPNVKVIDVTNDKPDKP